MATMRDKLISYDFLPINGSLFDEEPDFDEQDYDISPLWMDTYEQSGVELPIQFCYGE